MYCSILLDRKVGVFLTVPLICNIHTSLYHSFVSLAGERILPNELVVYF